MGNKTQTEKGNLSDAKSEVKQTAQQVQDKVQDKSADAANQAKEIARQAEQEARSTLSTQKIVAARELHGVSQALRQTSDQLRQQDQDIFAEYSNRAADQVERVSAYLEERDLDSMIYDAENFARRQPELFLGGAFTLGLLAARFLKSSAPDYRQGMTQQPTRRLDAAEMDYTRRSRTYYPRETETNPRI